MTIDRHNHLRDVLAVGVSNLIESDACIEPFLSGIYHQDSNLPSYIDKMGVKVRADVAAMIGGDATFFDCAINHPFQAKFTGPGGDWCA